MKHTTLKFAIFLVAIVQSGALLCADASGRWAAPLFGKWAKVQNRPESQDEGDVKLKSLINECTYIFSKFEYPARHPDALWSAMITNMREHYGSEKSMDEAFFTAGEWSMPLFQEARGDEEFDTLARVCDEMLEQLKGPSIKPRIYQERVEISRSNRFFAYVRARHVADQKRVRAYLDDLSPDDLLAFKAECPTKEDITELAKTWRNAMVGEEIIGFVYEKLHEIKKAEFIHGELDAALARVRK